MVETWPPRKMRATIAMIAMSARISAYSARPWPSSSRRNDAIRALSLDIMFTVHLPSEKLPETARGPGHTTGGIWRCQGRSTDSRCQRVNGRKQQKTAGQKARRSLICRRFRLDRVAHVAQDRRDLAAQENEGNDRDDGDQGEDQGVLSEALALFVATDGRDESRQFGHVTAPPFRRSPRKFPRNVLEAVSRPGRGRSCRPARLRR